MNVLSGIIVLSVTGVLYLKYRPKLHSSLSICLMAGFLGVIPLFLTDGPLLLQLIQHVMQATVLVCCFVKLRQERILTNRRKARLKHCKCSRNSKYQAPSQSNSRVCA
jgi:hypothetical protein